jgi:ribokinase
MPPELAPAAALLDWRGPQVSPDDLPHFEIVHEPGGITTYLKGGWGTARHLTVDDIPADLKPGIASVVPMRDATRRLEIILRLQREGWTVGCGTYGGATRKRRDDVLEVLSVADVFFCNEAEAATLFGSADRARTSAGKVLYVTLGARGARVIEESEVTHVDGARVEELDPTGAGDTFCGTTLAHLARGASPVAAARAGVVAAAHMVTGVGPERLL